MYKNLDKHICDRCYHVETKSHGVFTGYMLNYNGGNIVMVTKKGVIHMPYSETVILKPLDYVPDGLRKIIEEL